MFRRVYAGLLVFCLTASNSFAATIHVPADQPTIQAGINAAVNGDTVLVAPGVYAEHINFNGKKITVMSAKGADSTAITKIVDGLSLVLFKNGEDTNSVLEGFTLFGASSVSLGAAVSCQSVSPTIKYNVFRGNNNSGFVVYFYFGAPRLENNVFYGNNSDDHVVRSDLGTALIVNNTIVQNLSGGGIYLSASRGDIVSNNVIVLNSGRGVHSASGGYALLDYNDVWGNSTGQYFGIVPGPNSISLDPLFCDTASHDFTLSSTSPCIGTGEAGANMGAFGIGCGLPEVVNINVGGYVDSLHITNHTPSFAWKYFDSQGSPLTKSELQVGADTDWTVAEMWQPPTINSSDTSITYAGLPLLDGTTYFVRIRVHNDTIWSNWKSAAFHMNSIPGIPMLRTPAINGMVASLTPALTIKNAFDVEGDSLLYTYQVSPDSFTSVIYTFTKKQDPDSITTLIVDSTLTENARYWWRVKASDYYEESTYSEIHSFYVNASNSAPASFSLVAPPSGIVTPLTTLQPTFSWGAALDLDPFDSVSYTFYLAIDSSFVFVSQVAGLVTTSYAVTDSLQWSRRYWWKVKAADRNGGTTWSNQVFTFRTVTPGDADNNGVVSLSDVVYIVNYIFASGPAPQPLPSGDADCSGKINLADAVYLINYIFADGPPPCGRF